MKNERLQQLFGFLEFSPKDAFILFAIAKEYESLKITDKALEFYLKVQQADVNYVGTYYHLGKLQEQLNDFTAALAAYDKGIEVAKTVGDRHALGELMEARMMIEDE